MYKQITAEIDSRHAFYTRMCFPVLYYPFACPSVRRVVFPPLCHSPVRRLRARLPLLRGLLCYLIEALPFEVFLKQGGNLAHRVPKTFSIFGESGGNCRSYDLAERSRLLRSICRTRRPPTQVPDYPRAIRSSMSLQR